MGRGAEGRTRPASRPAGRFLLIFLAALLAFQVLYYQVIVPSSAFAAYLDLITHAAAWLLRAVGEDVSANGSMMSGEFSMSVRAGCDGLQVMAILGLGILVYPSSTRRKLWGLAAGIPALLFLNVARLASLHWAGSRWPNWVFQSMHIHVWPALLIFFVLGFWTVWALRSDRIEGTP